MVAWTGAGYGSGQVTTRQRDHTQKTVVSARSEHD
jgi:hypothetical protein